MTVDEVISELKRLGNAGIKKTLMNHGAREPFFGVKVEDLKKIQKRVKMNYQLALDLFDTGIADAQYLAGLIADDARMTKKDLNKWVNMTDYKMICEYAVPWVASGSEHGYELALEWIDSKKEHVASAGWATFSSIASITDDADLDIPGYQKLLARVAKSIHAAPNRVKYAMNNFVIAVGSYIKPLSELAIKTAQQIGTVTVDMGGTSCKVPAALDYIKKVHSKGRLGKKRPSAKC